MSSRSFPSSRSFAVNGRRYEHPGEPVVVICIDGSEPDYHRRAIEAGQMPWLARALQHGASNWPAHCAMPALTNPNNVSIATGLPPAGHGVSGNYFLDPDTGEEVLMNDSSLLRAPTIFSAAHEAGLQVAVVTAKDKLRRLLGAGLVEPGPALDGSDGAFVPSGGGICFSAEKADEDVLTWVGRPLPSVYSADLSEFVLASGVTLLRERRPDLLYLSLTDYIQHKHAPGTAVANAFYAMIDRYAAQLDELGAVVVITADHGMSAKTTPDGTPRVIYLEEEIAQILGPDAAADGVRVILPITDPYTVHHGALGSFATVHLPAQVDPAILGTRLARVTGIQAVHTRADAADRYQLPPDRIGDLVVLAEENTALGRHPRWHDLSGLDAPLRSHGALGEINIPFIINRPLSQPADLEQDYADPACVHNYDAFWVATSGVSGAGS